MTLERSNSSREDINNEISMFSNLQDEFSSHETSNPLRMKFPPSDGPNALADTSKRAVYLHLHQRERDHRRHIKGLRSVFTRLTKKLNNEISNHQKVQETSSIQLGETCLPNRNVS